MENLNRLFASILFCLCFTCGLAAQENIDYNAYMDASGKNAVLFRGKRSFNYNVLYNGHCYWNTPEFLVGEVVYNGKHYYDVFLNIDACRHEILAKNSERMMPMVLVADNVEWFTMGGDKYTRLEGRSKKKLPEDFCQILYSDDHITVYKRVHKVFTSNTMYNNGGPIGYEDPDYDSRVLNFFQYNVKYYCQKDGVIKKIGKGKARKLAGRQ